MAFVLGKGEERLARGEHHLDAITLALEDHPVAPGMNGLCRQAWSAMMEETIRETLARQGYLPRVRRHIHSAYSTDHIQAMEEALGWNHGSPCGSAMRRLADTYAAYAAVIRETTGDPVPIEQMVDTMLVMVVG